MPHFDPRTRDVHHPGTRYCGPGNVSGTPTNRLDAACQRHDAAYQGMRDYIPLLNSDRARQADRQLVGQAAASMFRRDASVGERVQSFAVGGYMSGKIDLDNRLRHDANTMRNLGMLYRGSHGAGR